MQVFVVVILFVFVFCRTVFFWILHYTIRFGGDWGWKLFRDGVWATFGNTSRCRLTWKIISCKLAAFNMATIYVRCIQRWWIAKGLFFVLLQLEEAKPVLHTQNHIYLKRQNKHKKTHQNNSLVSSPNRCIVCTWVWCTILVHQETVDPSHKTIPAWLIHWWFFLTTL